MKPKLSGNDWPHAGDRFYHPTQAAIIIESVTVSSIRFQFFPQQCEGYCVATDPDGFRQWMRRHVKDGAKYKPVDSATKR